MRVSGLKRARGASVFVDERFQSAAMYSEFCGNICYKGGAFRLPNWGQIELINLT